MSLKENILNFICRRSYRVYQSAHYQTTRVFDTRKVVIPIRFGLGMSNVFGRNGEIVHAFEACKRVGYRGYFVDVGTNIGQSLIAYISTGISGSYIGFEPA